MPFDLTEPLVIGVSSRALFNLEAENRIFEEQGVEAYTRYQIQHENEILQQGAAFQLVQSFLQLNNGHENPQVEVIIMSRNCPDTSLRIFKSIEHYGLDITRAALVGGAKMAKYLRAFKTDLFLSAEAEDVQAAVNEDIAAAQIITKAAKNDAPISQIRIAFDGDAVLFSSEAERVYQHEGMDAFMQHEKNNADIPLREGPFANFLKALAHIQSESRLSGEASPIRIALVTSRNAPAHERAIKTLRAWNVRIDEAFFLGGVRKKEILEAFGAHIFFDDQPTHAGPASEVVNSAIVPYRDGDDPRKE